ncbi:C6 zinc finger domain protein [Aspergillus luchuensis]|uniref:C6 zinc finger domain protein n=1 Tax=Aspergillus kawachii TaxID=1069201 RepID=A0A146FWF8_ASPKA|nr:C6 zinc finger domain protein [Aspergillus luchuensis]
MVVVIGVLKLEWSRKGRAGVELEEVKISAAAKKLLVDDLLVIVIKLGRPAVPMPDTV